MLGGIVALLVVAVLVFQWDWLIPFVQTRASAALGRPVTITHLHVRLGKVPHIEADGVVIGNPADWPGGGNLATIDKLGIDLDAMAYIRRRQVVIPAITVDHPVAEVQQLADGRNNYTFPSGDPNAPPAPPDQATQIGDLRVTDGHAHVAMAKLRADFNVDVATSGEAGHEQLVASAKGTYANQPITAKFTGGALLSLRDAAQPYPIDLALANGPTRVSLKGTVQNPLSFAGADVKLDIAGPDMSLLLPLTGIAIPKTPPYHVAGQLDYTQGVVKFTKSQGKVGSSDLEGDIEVDTKPETRPVVTANLSSRLVDLKDLGGFIGAEPGDAARGTRRATASNGRVLPNDPINLPKLNAADMHLKYRAARIQGRSQPLDNMQADLDIVNGNVALHPLAFGIGGGQITGADRPGRAEGRGACEGHDRFPAREPGPAAGRDGCGAGRRGDRRPGGDRRDRPLAGGDPGQRQRRAEAVYGRRRQRERAAGRSLRAAVRQRAALRARRAEPGEDPVLHRRYRPATWPRHREGPHPGHGRGAGRRHRQLQPV